MGDERDCRVLAFGGKRCPVCGVDRELHDAPESEPAPLTGERARKLDLLDRLIVAALAGGAPLTLAQNNAMAMFEMRESARRAWQEGRKWP